MGKNREHHSPVITCGLVTVSMEDGSTNFDLIANSFKRLFARKRALDEAKNVSDAGANDAAHLKAPNPARQ